MIAEESKQMILRAIGSLFCSWRSGWLPYYCTIYVHQSMPPLVLVGFNF